MRTLAKFRCNEVTQLSPTLRKYKLAAVCDKATPENEKFQKYTPSGNLEIQVDNPDIGFEIFKEYYLDFTLADDEVLKDHLAG